MPRGSQRAEVLARSFPMKSFSGSAGFLSVFTLSSPRESVNFSHGFRSSRILAGILGLLAGLCRSPGFSLSSRSQHSVRLRSSRPGLFCKALLSYTDTRRPLCAKRAKQQQGVIPGGGGREFLFSAEWHPTISAAAATAIVSLVTGPESDEKATSTN